MALGAQTRWFDVMIRSSMPAGLQGGYRHSIDLRAVVYLPGDTHVATIKSNLSINRMVHVEESLQLPRDFEGTSLV